MQQMSGTAQPVMWLPTFMYKRQVIASVTVVSPRDLLTVGRIKSQQFFEMVRFGLQII